MKYFKTFMVACILISTITSCTVNRKITFHGTPGMEIYNQSTKLGTIDNNGTAKIKLPRDGYIPYLLIYDNKNKRFYPYGVDYYYRSRIIDNIVNYCVFIPGPNTIVFFPWLCNLKYFSSDQVLNGYRYLRRQDINKNFPNAPYANTGERRKVNVSTKTSSLLLSKSASSSSPGSKLLRTDYSKQLQGEYTGNGKLLQGNSTIERYSNMTINITPVDKNSVSVKVLMDGSEEVLAPCNYKIGNQGDNYFVLTSEDDELAIIEIKNSKALYNNPNVNIDGEIYNLQITAEKE